MIEKKLLSIDTDHLDMAKKIYANSIYQFASNSLFLRVVLADICKKKRSK